MIIAYNIWSLEQVNGKVIMLIVVIKRKIIEKCIAPYRMKVIKAVVKGFKLYFSSHVVYKVLAVLLLRLFDRSLR